MSNEEETEFIDIPQAEIGNYVLMEKLGEGGMGAVFKASHKVMGRVVAIKMLSAAGLKDQQTVERFQREVRAAAKLQHPNIVAALDADQVGDKTYLVMEYVAGVDLAQWVKQQGPMPVAQAIQLVRQAGCGLEAAHRAGIVHRDIKPANLILNDKGVVKILDMGLARMDQDVEQQNLTSTGQVVGTVTYMSPEQAMSTKHVDARTDIYSLGCTLYFLLTGMPPYQGETVMQTLMAHKMEAIPNLQAMLPSVPPGLQPVFERMMAKRPEHRFANMTDCLTALADVQAGRPPSLLDTRSTKPDPTQRKSQLQPVANRPAHEADTGTTQFDLTAGRLGSLLTASSRPPWWKSPLGMTSLGGAAFALILLTVVFMLRTPSGTLVIEVNEPGATVSIDGEQRVQIQQPGGKSAVPVEVDEKQHELKVTKDGFAIFTRQFSMKGEREQFIRVRLEPTKKPDVEPVAIQPSPERKAADERSDNGLEMKFCWCPPGTFIMGSPLTEKDRDPDEAQAEVTLTQGFWLGKYEVTQAEYKKVTNVSPSGFAAQGNRRADVAGLDTSRFPVENVGWAEAVAYCQKLTEQERAAGRLQSGWEYRLPTEAQWEYACRAGTTDATAFGNKMSSKQANFRGESPYQNAEAGPDLGRPCTVGSYPPNAWGLHDMHGNVWEHCQDLYGDKLTGGFDPSGPQMGTSRVNRGGCWAGVGHNCRSASRLHNVPALRFDFLGFRVALVSTQQAPSSITSFRVGQKAGEEWYGNQLRMKFCWCPPGKFMMGSPAAEPNRDPSKEIQVEVELSKGIWMGKFEVTQAEYNKLMEHNPSQYSTTGIQKAKLMGHDTNKFPVENVSWSEAMEFARRLTEQEQAAGRLQAGWEYRLPTEAEWEYACRAGTATATSFGEKLSSKQANFKGLVPYNDGEVGPNLARPTTVGSYPANAWGLHDMHGNVWEWCRDLHHEKLAGGTDPQGPPWHQSLTNRVDRGGGWYDEGQYCRSANRIRSFPGVRYPDRGFRLAIGPILQLQSVNLPTIVPATSNHTAGEKWTLNGLGISFCWCPAGKFTMGSPATEQDRGTDENQVEVSFYEGFWLGTHEVTQAAYLKVMGNNPSYFSSTGKGATEVAGIPTSLFPVEQVSVVDAEEFCRKLTAQEQAANRLPSNWAFRLPTEAEWEYACRAGETKATSFGDSLSALQANFLGEHPYNGAKEVASLKRTCPVGSYPANAWGLYDMHGNVWEWCQDAYADRLLGGSRPMVRSSTPLESLRVLRGGSWYTYGLFCRSAQRGKIEPTIRYYDRGFRPVVGPVLQPTLSVPSPGTSIKVGQKAGEEWNSNSYKMPFCWCPPGKFTMGSPETEKDRIASREAQVEVTLTKGFWMGKYEVTQAEYQSLMGAIPSGFSPIGNQRDKLIGVDTSRLPVENVSAMMAEDFCRRLTEKEHAVGRLPKDWEYRLPTEAEWEYACRAGTTTATSCGDQLSSHQANIDGDFPYHAETGPNLGRPAKSGSYPANAWGLHDMHGNVWEWCRDKYADQLPGGANPSVKEGAYQVYRGGSWGFGGSAGRSAYRSKSTPTHLSNDRGFRLVLAPASAN